MGVPELKKKYNYADYLSWPQSERWEIIYGEPYNMSPAPKSRHQFIAGNLFAEFSFFLKGKKCRAVISPFDVRLHESLRKNDEEVETIVQPDISIFCNPNLIDEKGATGAPDLIVEILSESSRFKDLNIKLLLYQKFKVQEYWIIDPDTDSVYQYVINEKGLYDLIKEYTKTEKISPTLFPDLEIKLEEIFSN